MATLTIIVIAVAVSVITGVATFLGVRARSKSIIKEAEAEGEMIKKEKMLQAKEKFIQLKSEHDKQVNAGLILRVRQGVGKPNRIYTLLPKKEDDRDE